MLSLQDFACEASTLAKLEANIEIFMKSSEKELSFTDGSPGTVKFKVVFLRTCLEADEQGSEPPELLVENSLIGDITSSVLRKKLLENKITISLPQLMKGSICFKFRDGGIGFVQNFAKFCIKNLSDAPAWMHLESQLLKQDFFCLSDLQVPSNFRSLSSILFGVGILPETNSQQLAYNSDDWYDVCLLIAGDQERFRTEMDCLKEHVFPALQYSCLSLRVNFSWIESNIIVDSNPGASSDLLNFQRDINLALESKVISRIGKGQTKHFILNMVDCEIVPFLITRPDQLIITSKTNSWVNDAKYLGLSVEEIELYSGFLNQPNASECIFYFRDEKKIDLVHKQESEETNKLSANALKNRKTLMEVRQYLNNAGLSHRLLESNSLTSFSIFALTRLWDIILHYHGPQSQSQNTQDTTSDRVERERAKQEELLRFYSSGYIETEEVKQKLLIFEKAAKEISCHLICYGSPGSGKTSLLAHFASSIQRQGSSCLYYFGGSADEFAVNYLSAQLLQMCLKPTEKVQNRDPAKYMAYALKSAAVLLRPEEYLFLVLDNLSAGQLDMITAVVLPLCIDLRVRCVISKPLISQEISCVHNDVTIVTKWNTLQEVYTAMNPEKVAQNTILEIRLNSLNYCKSERLALIGAISKQLDVVLNKKERIKIIDNDLQPSPHYIYMSVARQASVSVSSLSPKRNFLPKSLDDLFAETVLERSESGWERDLIDDILCFLAICRQGISLAVVIEMSRGIHSLYSGAHNIVKIILPLRPFLKPWLRDCCNQLEFLNIWYKERIIQKYCVDSEAFLTNKITLLHKKLSAVLLGLADPYGDKSWRGCCRMPYVDLVYHLCESVKGDTKDRASLDTVVELVSSLNFIHAVIVRHPLKVEGLLEQFQTAIKVLKTLRDLEDVSKSLQADAIDAQLQKVKAFEDFVLSKKDILDLNDDYIMKAAMHYSNEIVKTVAVTELEMFLSLLHQNAQRLQDIQCTLYSHDADLNKSCLFMAELGKLSSQLDSYLEIGCLQVLCPDELKKYNHYKEQSFETVLFLRKIFLSGLKKNDRSFAKQQILQYLIENDEDWSQNSILNLDALSMQMNQCNALPWADLGYCWETLFIRKSFFLKFSNLVTTGALNSIRQILFRNSEQIKILFIKYKIPFTENSAGEGIVKTDDTLKKPIYISEIDKVSLKGIWVFMMDYDLLGEHCSLCHVNQWAIGMHKTNSDSKCSVESDWHKGEKLLNFQDFLEILLCIAEVSFKEQSFMLALDTLCEHIKAPASEESKQESILLFSKEAVCNEDLVSVLKSDVEGMLITHEKRFLSCFQYFAADEKSSTSSWQGSQQEEKEQIYYNIQSTSFARLCKSLGLVGGIYDQLCLSLQHRFTLGKDKLPDQGSSKWEMTFIEFLGFIALCAHKSQKVDSLAEAMRLWLSKLVPVLSSQATAFDPHAPAGQLWPQVKFRIRNESD